MTKDIEREALIAEIEQFKAEAMKMHIVECWTETYKTDPFSYEIDGDSKVIWLKAQARQLWDFWQAAKALEAKKLEGCVVVPVEPTEAMIEAMEQFDDRHDYADMESAYRSMIEVARGGNE